MVCAWKTGYIIAVKPEESEYQFLYLHIILFMQFLVFLVVFNLTENICLNTWFQVYLSQCWNSQNAEL